MTPERLKSLTDDEIIKRMSADLDWRPFQAEYNRRVVAFNARALSQVERFDFREREKLKEWGPDDRHEIIGDALERLTRTGNEGIAEIAPILGALETAQQFSEMLCSTLDPYTLAKRAVNTARINYTNRRPLERERQSDLPDDDQLRDRGANTERDALLERAGSSLTDLERSLLKLRLEGHSFRDIEEGTAARGWKVDRREISEIWGDIEAKLQASGVDPESSWRLQAHSSKKKNADEQAEQLGQSIYDDQDRIAQLSMRERSRTLDRDARRNRRPATEAELQECRDAMAAVDARVGGDDVRTTHARVVPGALSEHYREVEKIMRDITPSGRHASAEQDKPPESSGEAAPDRTICEIVPRALRPKGTAPYNGDL